MSIPTTNSIGVSSFSPQSERKEKAGIRAHPREKPEIGISGSIVMSQRSV